MFTSKTVSRPSAKINMHISKPPVQVAKPAVHAPVVKPAANITYKTLPPAASGTFIFDISTVALPSDLSSNLPIINHRNTFNLVASSLSDANTGLTTVSVNWSFNEGAEDSFYSGADLSNNDGLHFVRGNYNNFGIIKVANGLPSEFQNNIKYFNHPSVNIKQFGRIPLSRNRVVFNIGKASYVIGVFQGFTGKIIAGDAPSISKNTSLNSTFCNSTVDASNVSIWDTSGVVVMNDTFVNSKIVQNISAWNTSNVTQMFQTFGNSSFTNQDISNWNTAKVVEMGLMFANCNFNPNISNWNTSSVIKMAGMFLNNKKFNQDLSNWNTSKVKRMDQMFSLASAFNQDLSNWNTSSLTDSRGMFDGATSFNNAGAELRTDGDKWNMSKVTNMAFMFESAPLFNQDISNWNTSKVTNMSRMFWQCVNFNQDISGFDLSGVTTTRSMFNGAAKFNQPVNLWNTKNVKDMSFMFSGASAFDQDVSSWNTSNVEEMQQTFSLTKSFNQDVSKWNISKVKTMSQMFYKATAFNNGGNSLNWNTSNVENMSYMFYNAVNFIIYADPINSIGKWDFTKVVDASGVSNANSKFYGFAFKIGTSAEAIDCSANFAKFLSDLCGNTNLNDNLNMGLVGIKNSISTPNESLDYLTNVKNMKIIFRDSQVISRDINLNGNQSVFNNDEHDDINGAVDYLIETEPHANLYPQF